jgi:hypothetical protein
MMVTSKPREHDVTDCKLQRTMTSLPVPRNRGINDSNQVA